MNRRELLQGFSLLPLALVLPVPEALAMGGILPPLNQAAPAFDLEGVVPSGKGKASKALAGHRSLADFQGRWLVLYFYPRDFTGGCTLEARGFQRDLAAFHQAGAEVVGISADDPESHASFCGSEALTFPLLSDPGGRVSQRYGSWIAPFSQRHTFLIDPEGILRSNWLAVRPQGHSQEVLEALRKLQNTSLSVPLQAQG